MRKHMRKRILSWGPNWKGVFVGCSFYDFRFAFGVIDRTVFEVAVGPFYMEICF